MKLLKKCYQIIIICFLLLLTSCSTSFYSVEQIISNNKLYVVTNAEFAPFEYKEGKVLKGIDIDIIKEYGKYLGVDVIITDTDFDSTLVSVSTNKADLAIAAITRNEKREKNFLFSDSYYSASQVMIVRDDSKYLTCSNVKELLDEVSRDGIKIGCQRGTTGQYYIEGSSDWDFEGISNSTCVMFDNGSVAVKALSNGQIDGVIIDLLPAQMYCKKFSNVKIVDLVLVEEEYAIAVNKKNTSLKESLDNFINKIKTDGTLESIVEVYYE